MKVDAVVIGSGPNGLVAANQLADRGWDVVVVEANAHPGGAVRSAELVEPGFVNDLFSSFYPLGAASPHIQALGLQDWGVRWRRSDAVVAHPTLDGTCVTLHTDLERTCESLERFAPGDGDGWRQLYGLWERVGEHMTGALFTPFPPIRPVLGMAARLGADGLVRFARMSVLPVRRLGEETFRGDGGRRLLAGNALHADLTPEAAPGGFFGWMLCCLGQQYGFPVPEGGAGKLTEALVARLRARNGEVVCGQRVVRVEVRGGRAVAAVTEGGERHEARRAILADVGAPQLYLDLVGRDRLPGRLVEDLANFQYDNSTVKVDWALDGPIPWRSEEARAAGTVHVAEGVDALTKHAGELARCLVPETPWLVMGQYACADPTRAPEGKDTAWAYTHIPQHIKGDAGGDITGRWDEAETQRFADRMEEQVEALAPGFRKLVRGRHVFTPPSMEAENPNLVGGAVNGGTAQIHQQLLFRPTASLGRPETPVDGLYLASASAHPGGGVHGGCGANAARAALAGAARTGMLPFGRLSRVLQR